MMKDHEIVQLAAKHWRDGFITGSWMCGTLGLLVGALITLIIQVL